MWSPVVLASAVLLNGCRDNPLSVDNTQQPNVGGFFATPGNVETAISKLFEQMYNGQLGSADDVFTQTITMSFESSSQLGNFGMGTRGAIPRAPIDNSIGNNVAIGNFRDLISEQKRPPRGHGDSGFEQIHYRKQRDRAGHRRPRRQSQIIRLFHASDTRWAIWRCSTIRRRSLTGNDPLDPSTGNYTVPAMSVSSAVMTAAWRISIRQ